MNKTYSDYAASKTIELLGIDSPTGFTVKAADWVKAQFEALGYPAKITEKGGVLIDLGGENAADALLLEAHTDTLGGMVAEIKSSGRLLLTNLGGLCAANCETENARLYTRGGAVIEGTLQLCNASIHVNGDFADTKRSFDTTELVLDEDVKSAEDTRALGVEVGDFVCFDPRTRITASGYIKSRFLDDKLSVGILLGLAKYMKDTGAKPERRVYAHITVYEEVGHGGAGSVPVGVTEAISVDMGCIGDGLQCTERQVSICAKDSGALTATRLSASSSTPRRPRARTTRSTCTRTTAPTWKPRSAPAVTSATGLSVRASTQATAMSAVISTAFTTR